MKALSYREVTENLSVKLPKWTFNGDFIRRDFTFKNFMEAFSFMNTVALEAEKMAHHPDWCNLYNNVTINLQTHDVSGITRLDLDLARIIDRLFVLHFCEERNK
jgi:4a-hydroxytetrahydrobiopterin dehydratase